MSVPTAALPSLSYQYSSHQELHSDSTCYQRDYHHQKHRQKNSRREAHSPARSPLSASPLSSMRHTANLPSPRAASSASTSSSSLTTTAAAATAVAVATAAAPFPHSRHQPWQPHLATSDADGMHVRRYSHDLQQSGSEQEAASEPFRPHQPPHQQPLSASLPPMPPPRTLPPPHAGSTLAYRPHYTPTVAHPEAVELQHPSQPHTQQHIAQQHQQQQQPGPLFRHPQQYHRQQQQQQQHSYQHRHSAPSLHSPLPSYRHSIHSPAMPQQQPPSQQQQLVRQGQGHQQQQQQQQYPFMAQTVRQLDSNNPASMTKAAPSQHPPPAHASAPSHHRPYDLQSPAPASRTFWNHYETSLLVQLWLEFEAQFMANKRNAGVWAQLAERLTERSGRHRTVRECRIKWKNMWAKHRDLVNASHMSLDAKLREFPHFSDFVEIKQRSTLQSSANDNTASEGKLSPPEEEPHAAAAAAAGPSAGSPHTPATGDGPEYGRFSAYTAPTAIVRSPPGSISPPTARAATDMTWGQGGHVDHSVEASGGGNVGSSAVYPRRSSSPTFDRTPLSRQRRQLPQLHIASRQQHRIYQSHQQRHYGYHSATGSSHETGEGSSILPPDASAAGHQRAQPFQATSPHYSSHHANVGAGDTAISGRDHPYTPFPHHHQQPALSTPAQPLEPARHSSLTSILAGGSDQEYFRPQPPAASAKPHGSSALHHLLSPAVSHPSADTTPSLHAVSSHQVERRPSSSQISRRNSTVAAALPTTSSRSSQISTAAGTSEHAPQGQRDAQITDIPEIMHRIDHMEAFDATSSDTMQEEDAHVDLVVGRMRALVKSSPAMDISNVAQQIMSYIEKESRRRQLQSERHHRIVVALADIISGASTPATMSSGVDSRRGSTRQQQQQHPLSITNASPPRSALPQGIPAGRSAGDSSPSAAALAPPAPADQDAALAQQSSGPNLPGRSVSVGGRASPESGLTISPILSSRGSPTRHNQPPETSLLAAGEPHNPPPVGADTTANSGDAAAQEK